MIKNKIIILGAGLSGLSAAWHLQKKGIDCQIFEKESKVGGLCKSENLNGFTFDCSGHLLHFKKAQSFDFIRSLIKGKIIEHKRSSWIHAYNRYIRYPFQANLYGLPVPVIKDCIFGFIHSLKNCTPRDIKDLSFADWIQLTFGKGIAKHFLTPYNKKFWTIPLRKLTCEWLDGFIPVPTLSQILDGTIQDSQRQFGYNACFWYPRQGGINQIPLALAGQIRNIYTGDAITEINLKEKKISFSSGSSEKFTYLISTIPLPEMGKIIKDLPNVIRNLFSKLRWNSIFNLNLGIEKKDLEIKHWIYFPQPDLCFFRVGFFHNFSSFLAPPNKGSLYIEVSYSKENPLDKKSIVRRIYSDLKKVNILKDEDNVCCQQINDIEFGYPIYDFNYSNVRKIILQYLLRRNLIPCGRYGSWRYMSMEDCILEGGKIADRFK